MKKIKEKIKKLEYEMTKNLNPQTFCAAMTLLILVIILRIRG